MVVNDRVEAAEKIRSYGEWLDVYSYTSAAPKAIDRLRDAIIDTYDYAVLLDGLADLIDPTCHNKQIEINKMAPLEFRTDNLICSNCGETFCADPDGINAPIDWAYCPNCGYRIVETNSGEDNNSER